MSGVVHLVKLCVGAEEVGDLERWQARPEAKNADGHPIHVTRMWPKRQAELLNGGSLYWVFKGTVLARQRIIDLQQVVGDGGVVRCGIVFDRRVQRTHPRPLRPFQGWRYLKPDDAPRDLSEHGGASMELPANLLRELEDIGVLEMRPT